MSEGWKYTEKDIRAGKWHDVDAPLARMMDPITQRMLEAAGRKALEWAARQCDANAADLTIEAESHEARGWPVTGNELRKQAMQARDDAAAIRAGVKS